MEVEGVEPPAVESSSERVPLMIIQETARCRILDPAQMREELFPLTDHKAVLEKTIEVLLVHDDGLQGQGLRNVRLRWFLADTRKAARCSLAFIRLPEATWGEDGSRPSLGTLENDAPRLVRESPGFQVFVRGCKDLQKLIQGAKISLENWKKDPGSVGLKHHIERPVNLGEFEDAFHVKIVTDIQADLRREVF